VLEVTIAPGEREPEHTHRWPSVMVVHRPARIRYYTGDTVTFASPEQPSPAAPHGSAGSIPQADIRWRTSTGMSTEPSVSSSSSFNVALVGLVRDRGEIQPVWHRPSRPRRPGGASSRSAAEPASLSTLSIRTSTSASTFFRSTHLTEGGSPGHISAGGSWSGIPGRGRSIACGRRMKSSATRRSRPTHAFSSLAARARRPLHHRDIHREYRCP
jgi:hypothetical protein